VWWWLGTTEGAVQKAHSSRLLGDFSVLLTVCPIFRCKLLSTRFPAWSDLKRNSHVHWGGRVVRESLVLV